MAHPLQWKKFHPLSDQNAFICLVDHMGDDSSIVQAARVSYGKDDPTFVQEYVDKFPEMSREELIERKTKLQKEVSTKDRKLLRLLLRHSHTTPFEMVEIKFMVQVPMDCWRQWIRHRTASVNEYSTRYTEALDFSQTTPPQEWRLQATDNKQGSSGFLDEDMGKTMSEIEVEFQQTARNIYEFRLQKGIAKEQARKDLPLSTYTRAYWKCDLHNIFNFLRLRMDSHAQYEIRSFANSMFYIVKQICPVACEAFEDYVLHAKKFSRMEMEIIRNLLTISHNNVVPISERCEESKPDSMTDREWKEFLNKLS